MSRHIYPVLALAFLEVARLIQILASLRYNQIMEGSDLSAYGLTNGGIFTVRFEAGASHTLHVGKPMPTGTDACVQVNDNLKVYLATLADVTTLVNMGAKLAEATAVFPSPMPSTPVAVSPVP